jgi:hypothetical protein
MDLSRSVVLVLLTGVACVLPGGTCRAQNQPSTADSAAASVPAPLPKDVYAESRKPAALAETRRCER